MTERGSLDELIEALQIFRKYGNKIFPTHCEHDTLTVMVEPTLVSEMDKLELNQRGFFVSRDTGLFTSFRFGSA
jgi:hypothetical protein